MENKPKFMEYTYGLSREWALKNWLRNLVHVASLTKNGTVLEETQDKGKLNCVPRHSSLGGGEITGIKLVSRAP